MGTQTGEGTWEWDAMSEFGMYYRIESKVDFPFYGRLTGSGRGIKIELRDGEHIGSVFQRAWDGRTYSQDWTEEDVGLGTAMDIATDTTVFEDLYEPPKLIITGV